MPQRDDRGPSRTGQRIDDFQKITGIGSTFAPRLWNAGILTYDDLARLSPEEIAAVAGISAERIASQDWIGQARELAGPAPEASDSRQHYATFHVEFLLESDNRVRRTKVHHHQTDAREAWAGWDEERLLNFLRARIPLPAAETPAAAPAPEPVHLPTPDQPPAAALAKPASGPSPSAPERPPSWFLSIEELAPIRGDQRSYDRGPGEPNSARLTMRFSSARPLGDDTFDYSATIAARAFGGRDRSVLGTTEGTIRVSDPLSVEVTGPALPPGQYRLVATVEIYPAGHSPEEPPLHSQGVSGDLMRVADAPLGPAPAAA
jgi:hypothetical protein